MKGNYQKYKDTYNRNRAKTKIFSLFLNLEDNNDLKLFEWLEKIKSEVGGGRYNRRGVSNYLRKIALADIEKTLTKQKK